MCAESVHIALRTYFIVRSALEDSLQQTLERAQYLQQQLLSLIGPDAGAHAFLFKCSYCNVLKDSFHVIRRNNRFFLGGPAVHGEDSDSFIYDAQ